MAPRLRGTKGRWVRSHKRELRLRGEGAPVASDQDEGAEKQLRAAAGVGPGQKQQTCELMGVMEREGSRAQLRVRVDGLWTTWHRLLPAHTELWSTRTSTPVA